MTFIASFFIGVGLIFLLKAVGFVSASFWAAIWALFFILLGIYFFKKERDFRKFVNKVEKFIEKTEKKVEKTVSETFQPPK